MRRLTLALLLIVSSLVSAKDPPKGFTPLFNGKDLAGWHGMPHYNPYDLAKLSEAERTKLIADWTADAAKHWSAKDGDLVNDGNGAYLTTDKEYGDIEFLIDYKTVAQADSGIYLRCVPQIQIWDTTKEGGKWNIGADKGSGGLWNNSPGAKGKDPLVHADMPFGEWNHFRVIMVGEYVTVYLNEKLVVDHARLENFWNRKLPLMKKAPIQLQTHGGEIRWKNIFIREIPTDEANEYLKKKNTVGFKDVFNGKDFTGWTGAVDQYEVKDGAIVCLPHKGGNLFTKAEYADYTARVEYKVPPAGNNGLAIRYPGTGLPSEVGMCEVQVLDDDDKQYAKLDPRQYCGSVYGMIAAQRGYTRKPGEWNLMEVTVIGHKIQVELNGTRIVDGDVSEIKNYIPGHNHVGKLRTSGHFGFAGHSDPVAFKTVQIKVIDKK